MKYQSGRLIEDIQFLACSTTHTKHLNSLRKMFCKIEIKGEIGLTPITNTRKFIYMGIEYPLSSISEDAYILDVWLGVRIVEDNELMFHHG